MYFRHMTAQCVTRWAMGAGKEKKVTNKQATRQRLQLRRARTSTRDTDIVADFERGCTYMAWALSGMAAVIALMWAVM